MKVHLFLPSGKTFSFEDVRTVKENESTLTVEYTAQSDSETATLYVQKSAIVGWAFKAGA